MFEQHILEVFAKIADDIIGAHKLHKNAKLTYEVEGIEFTSKHKSYYTILSIINSTVRDKALRFSEFEPLLRPYSLRIFKRRGVCIVSGWHCFTQGFFKFEMKISDEDFIAIEGKIRDAIYKYVLEQMNYHEGAEVDYE